MVEGGRGAGFAQEALLRHDVVGGVGREHFERHETPHRRMFGEVNLAHAAGADLIENQVAADLEALVLASGKLVRVEPRDHARVDEPAQEIFASSRQMPRCAEAIEKAIEPLDRHEATAAKAVDQIGDGRGHGTSTKPSRRVETVLAVR